MIFMDPIGRLTIECPFCHKKTIKAYYWPPSREVKTSRSAGAGSKTKWYKVPERWHIASGCSNCNKTQKEVEKAFKKEQKEGKVLSQEEIIRRAKEAGLPLKIK